MFWFVTDLTISNSGLLILSENYFAFISGTCNSFFFFFRFEKGWVQKKSIEIENFCKNYINLGKIVLIEPLSF